MELKKSYKGLIIWMIGFLVCCFGSAFLEIDDVALLIRIIMNVMTLSMAVLTYMIYRNGYIYWYTGITYEEAAKVSEERRKACAYKHWKIFGIFAVVYFVFSVVMHLLQVGFWVDILVCTLGLVVIAVSTIWIKL